MKHFTSKEVHEDLVGHSVHQHIFSRNGVRVGVNISFTTNFGEVVTYTVEELGKDSEVLDFFSLSGALVYAAEKQRV